jgi:DNA mismatch endonuclease (patch repair protein)
MQGNRSRDTRPELAVRRLLTKLGYRYRLHARDLPGQPDIVFRGRRKVILVHGCFWHQHDSAKCKLRSHPTSNTAYWGPKLARNRARDAQVRARLAQDGWETLLVWECEVSAIEALANALGGFLGKPNASRVYKARRNDREE